MSNENINSRNIEALHEALKDQRQQISTMQEHIKRLENSVAYLTADLTTTKQLIGHTQGRGMGPTAR